MKLTGRCTLWAFGLAAAACVVAFVGLMQRSLGDLPFLRLEPGRQQHGTLRGRNLDRFRGFAEEIRVHYYVTPRADMPSHLRHLEEGVRDVLGAFQRAAEEHHVSLRLEVLHPEQHPEWQTSLASAGLATWRARTVQADGYREQELWSSLRIGYGPRPSAVLNGVGPTQVLELQNLILEQLEELRTPRRPRVAISAPAEGFDELRALLRSGADVVELDFNGTDELPRDTDLFFWVDPTRVQGRQLAALDALRARGGSFVLAGNDIDALAEQAPGTIEVRFNPTTNAMASLLHHHGLVPLEGLLLDSSAGELTLNGVQQFVPWHVRATATQQDFRSLVGQPNGSLLFQTPSAFYPDSARLSELGLSATLLASASPGATLHERPARALTTEDVLALAGRPQPTIALAALLRPASPWSGRAMLLADSAVFGDATWTHEHYAHQHLARIVLTHLLSSERLVASRIALQAPAPLQQLASPERTLWRAIVVLLLPACLALLYFLRERPSFRKRATSKPWLPLMARIALLVPLVWVLSNVSAGIDADLTQDGRNRLTLEERELFSTLLVEPIELDLVFSPASKLPPEFKPLVREVRRAVQRLSTEFNSLHVHSISPETLADAARIALEASGVLPLAVTSIQEESTQLFRVHAALRLRRGDEQVLLEFPSARSFRHLHFRLALGLRQLDTAKPTELALFAKAPRLSPAEATLEYQRKGLFTPREGDVFSELESLLREFDFHTTRLEPGRDSVPETADALVWLQPRRDLLSMTAEFSRWLARGGSALVAGQHFKILSRQLEGAGLDQRFWPEPQFFDLDRVYLPALGIELKREVVFDRSFGSAELATRVQSADGSSSYVNLPTTEPFLVVGSAQVGTETPVDCLMPFATLVSWDEPLLESNQIQVVPWITGGNEHWTYDWKGGDLPPELLQAATLAPDQEEDVTRAQAVGTYGAMFEGRFPRVQYVADPEPHLEAMTDTLDDAPGRLLLIGSSEAFKNDWLSAKDYGQEELALRSVASLALPQAFLPLLRERRHEPALGALDAATRSFWRFVVLGAAPGLLLLFGFLRRRWA